MTWRYSFLVVSRPATPRCQPSTRASENVHAIAVPQTANSSGRQGSRAASDGAVRHDGDGHDDRGRGAGADVRLPVSRTGAASRRGACRRGRWMTRRRRRPGRGGRSDEERRAAGQAVARTVHGHGGGRGSRADTLGRTDLPRTADMRWTSEFRHGSRTRFGGSRRAYASGHGTVSPRHPRFWRSPLRGPWFTSVLGVVLLGGITVLFVTGLLSYAAYNPDLSPVNDKTPDKGILGFYLFSWPTDPHWLYRLNQGVHVTLGITLIPVLLAKLWSVVPKLFALPPARSLAHALERISLLLLVGGALFEFVTGVLNVQLDYVFPGSFYPLHFYGAWVFFAAFVAHAVLRVPLAWRNLRRLAMSGRADDRRASWCRRTRRADRVPARRPLVRRRRLAAAVRHHGRAELRRRAAQNRPARPARRRRTGLADRAASRSTRRPRTRGIDRGGDERGGLAARRRGACGTTVRLEPRRAAPTPPAQRGVAHRLRGGLVHLRPVVARGAAAGPRGARRVRGRPARRPRGVAATARRLPAGRPARQPGRATRAPCSPCSSTART